MNDNIKKDSEVEIGFGYPSLSQKHLEGIPRSFVYPESEPYSMIKAVQVYNAGLMDWVCLTDISGSHTRNELVSNVKVYARALISRGVIPGRGSVAVAMKNSFEMVSVVMAANSIGVKVFFLDFTKDEDVLKDEALELSCSLLFCNDSVVYGDVFRSYSIPFFAFREQYLDYSVDIDEVMKKYEKYDDEPLIFINSSGSTNKPKILPFRNSAVNNCVKAVTNSVGINSRDPNDRRLMTILPTRLSYGFLTGFLPILWGHEVIFPRGVSPEDFAEYYKYGASWIFGTPIFLRMIMDATPENADFSSLKKFYSAGMLTPEELFGEAETFFKKHNASVKICNNYGFGESLGLGTTSDLHPHIFGRSGVLYFGCEFRVVNDDLGEVKYGKCGELVCSSKSLCDGYYQNPEATRASFFYSGNKLWFRTGDFVCLHADGSIQIMGRKSRFFQPTGASDKVSSELVEDVIISSKFVKNAAVEGITKANGTTVGRAYILLEQDSDKVDSHENIVAILKDKLRDFQIPGEFVYVDELPMMGSGKINHVSLKKDDYCDVDFFYPEIK